MTSQPKMIRFDDSASGTSFLYPEGWLVGRMHLTESAGILFTIIKPTTPSGELQDGTFHSGISLVRLADPLDTIRQLMEKYVSNHKHDKTFKVISRIQRENEETIHFTYKTLESLERIGTREIEVIRKCSFVIRRGSVVRIAVASVYEEFNEVSGFADAVLGSIVY